MSKKTNDPSNPLYQADITSVGLGPNDSVIDNNIDVPLTPDYAQTDPQVDAGTDVPMMPMAPPPGTIASYPEVSQTDHNMLGNQHYTMLGD